MRLPAAPRPAQPPTRCRWAGTLSAALGLLLASGLARSQQAATMDRAAAVRLSASVVRIEAPRPRGGFSLGSGVMVGPDLVVTNCHVTREASRVMVVRGGVRWPVAAQRADVEHDLCLLQAPGVVAPVVALADEAPPAIGQAVTALGYTGGVDLQHSFGEVVDLHRLDDGTVLQTSNGFNSGASGGGLFDGQGRLLGILTFRLRGGEQHYFAAPVRWVRQLLDAAHTEGLQPVAPLDPARQPYWQAQGEGQPRFLRANVLIGQQRWDDLAGLARRWLIDDAGDGEPWYLLGLALGQLDQAADARHALDCALRLQPQRQGAKARREALRDAPLAAPPPECHLAQALAEPWTPLP